MNRERTDEAFNQKVDPSTQQRHAPAPAGRPELRGGGAEGDILRAGRGQPSPEHGGSQAGTNTIATRLSVLARHLQQLKAPDELLGEMVAAAIVLVPGADQGSISEIQQRGRRIVHKAASSDLPRRVDALMHHVAQGPCLDAIWRQRTVRVDDLAAETRWPMFTRDAVALGARSMLSIQLFVEHHNLGALNLYSGRPHAFSDESENVGLLLASHAAVAYAGAQTATNLRTALETREAIGQAVGILMERYHLSSDRAFAVLVRFSQQSNRKLHSVADEIVHDTNSGHRTLPETRPTNWHQPHLDDQS